MAILITAIRTPSLSEGHVVGVVLSDVSNIYGHGGLRCDRVLSGNLQVGNRVSNIVPCTNSVRQLSSRRPRGQPAKRSRKNTDIAQNSTGLSRRVRGRLSEFPTVPLDVLFEVCNMRYGLVILAMPDKHGHYSDFGPCPPLRLALAHSREQGLSYYAPVSRFFVFME
jgi:hypothetical protein